MRESRVLCASLTSDLLDAHQAEIFRFKKRGIETPLAHVGPRKWAPARARVVVTDDVAASEVSKDIRDLAKVPRSESRRQAGRGPLLPPREVARVRGAQKRTPQLTWCQWRLAWSRRPRAVGAPRRLRAHLPFRQVCDRRVRD